MSLLKIGDVIELTKGHLVNTDIPEHFVYANRKGSWTLTHAGVRLDEDLSYLYGRYVVTHTTCDGGGGSPNDYYPDGHHVWCEHMDSGHKVDFWQTGCFGTLIKDIEPIGQAKPGKWEMTSE